MILENDDLNLENLTTESDIERCRKEVEQLKYERKYNAAMEKIISLFNAGHTDADLMMDLAQIYYDTQDYERAAVWANNTYNKSQDLEALLFLAKIYSSDDKMEQMAETLNSALEKPVNAFNHEQRKTIDDLLFYIELSYEEDEIEAKFPNAAKWLKNSDDILNAEIIDAPENTASILQEPILESSKEKNASALEITEMQIENNEDFDIQSFIMALVSGHDVVQSDWELVIKCNTELIMQTVSQINISLNKKILVLNCIASAFYQYKILEKAIVFLKAALEFNDQDDLILKNLGYIYYEQGNMENAMIVLQAVQNKDFMVCDLLQKCIVE